MMRGITDGVKHLIIVNVLFFIATQIYGDQMYQWFSLWYYQNPNFQLWQPISHMFMHGGLMHIVFNMYALWAFGTPLERMWGRNKFLFFYFSAGIGAALLHTGVNYYYFNEGVQALVDSGAVKNQVIDLISEGKYNTSWYDVVPKVKIDDFLSAFNTPVVGASGAVYGILVAFAFMFPNSELMLLFLPFPIKAKYFVPLLIAGDVFFGFSNINTGTAHFAHVGGAIAGFIMMWYWKKNQFNNKRWN